jgi:hypothetical protein
VTWCTSWIHPGPPIGRLPPRWPATPWSIPGFTLATRRRHLSLQRTLLSCFDPDSGTGLTLHPPYHVGSVLRSAMRTIGLSLLALAALRVLAQNAGTSPAAPGPALTPATDAHLVPGAPGSPSPPGVQPGSAQAPFIDTPVSHGDAVDDLSTTAECEYGGRVLDDDLVALVAPSAFSVAPSPDPHASVGAPESPHAAPPPAPGVRPGDAEAPIAGTHSAPAETASDISPTATGSYPTLSLPAIRTTHAL